MNAVKEVTSELASYIAALRRALDAPLEQQRLAFTEAEDQAIGDRINAADKAFRSTLQEAEEEALQGLEPDAVTQMRQQLDQSRDLMKRQIEDARKVLFAYRQKSKDARLKLARVSVMQRSAAAGERSEDTSGSSLDLVASLKRTTQVMTEEIVRVGSVSKVLDDGRTTLKSSHGEYDSVNAEIAEVRQRLKALQWQARQDKMWIAAGMAVLAWTVFFIVQQRTGFLIF